MRVAWLIVAAAVVIVAAAVVIVAAWQIGSTPAGVAQDQDADRIAALETQVAADAEDFAFHGREITRLKRRVTALEGGSDAADAGDAPQGGEPISLSGSGSRADIVHLEPGRYIVGIQFGAGVLQVNIYDEAGVAVMSSIVIGPDQTEGSSVITIDDAGDYAIDVTSGSDWTVTITPA